MPESAAPVPALEARRALDQLRLRSRVALPLEEPFEPRDAGQAVTVPPGRVRRREVLDDRSRRPWSETRRAEPLDRLFWRGSWITRQLIHDPSRIEPPHVPWKEPPRIVLAELPPVLPW